MIKLRTATEADFPLIMAWRSNPLVYQGFYQQETPLIWQEHRDWLRSRNQDWRTFIIEYYDRPVGVVTMGQLDHWSPEVGYYVGEVSLWGKGIGREAVLQALKWVKDYGRDYVHTTVLRSNERSIRLLKSLGFNYLGEARDGELWMQTKL